MDDIPYGRQDISSADIDAVIAVLRSEFLTQGPIVPAFEQAVASYCGANHAVAVNSATSALHIACLSLGVGKGDLVWTTPITFVASANCALYCGANIDFVDIDPITNNMSIERLSEKLSLAAKLGKLPKVVIPVHLCGLPCDMAQIKVLSQKYGFRIIEDASHAVGSVYMDGYVGGCQFSDITIFSFHPVKIITTGEGGMAMTNDSLLARRMRLLRSHGISNSSEDFKATDTNEIWNYQQLDLGFNYRMTDIQAALGLSQINRLNSFIKKRNQIALHYDDAFSLLPVQKPSRNPEILSSYHLYVIRILPSHKGLNQKLVYENMQKKGVRVNLHYIPVYRHPYYEAMGFKLGYCPEAEAYYREALSLPIFPAITDSEQERVIQVLRETLI